MTVIGSVVLIALGVIGYFLLSGAAFVSVYRWPAAAPTRFFSRFFAPLEYVARRFMWFGRCYNAFHQWCYRCFVSRREEA